MKKMKYYKNKRAIILFLFPAVLFIAVFLYYPFFMSCYKSFFNWDGFATSTFIGFDNYKAMFKDLQVRQAIKNTFFMMFLACAVQVGLGLLLAIIVDHVSKGAKFFKTVYFFPIVISATAIGVMFKLFYAYDGGPLNNLLLRFGKEPVNWLSYEMALGSVSVPIIWQYVGFYFVILLTAINGIPQSLYESAYLDGITGITKTIYITIPLIWDMIKVCLVLAITGSLKVFDMVFVITRGGPMSATELLGTYMYKRTFFDNRFGYGSTIAVFIVFLGIVVSSVVNRVLRSEEITY